MLAGLLGVIAVGLTDEPDGIRQQDMPLYFLGFVLLPLFVFFICDLLQGSYLVKLLLKSYLIEIFIICDSRHEITYILFYK